MQYALEGDISLCFGGKYKKITACFHLVGITMFSENNKCQAKVTVLAAMYSLIYCGENRCNRMLCFCATEASERL